MSVFLRHPTIKRLVENSKRLFESNDAPPEGRRVVSLEELRAHDGRDGGGWIAVCGLVYDMGPFFDGREKHPAGPKILRKHLGKDATHVFMQFHYPRGKAVKMAPGMLVGVLEKVEEDDAIEEEEWEDSEEEGSGLLNSF